MIPRLTQAPAVSDLTQSFLSQLSESGFSGDIETSYSSRLAMATDNSIYQILPQAVIYPKSQHDLQAVGQLAKSDDFQQITFSPRGGGTGTNGQSLNNGIIVDISRHMNQVLEINADEGWVRVQTGIIKDQLNDALKPHGLFFSPELSTSNRATIGGMINTDASGQGSLRYGKTSDHVLALTAVLADGTLINTQAIKRDSVVSEEREQVLYTALERSCVENRALIEDKFPKLNRFLTGYDLKHAYKPEEDELDLTRILCGSEGSLAFITEAKLNLLEIPNFRALVNIQYNSFESALRHAPTLVGANALSVETIDSTVLNLAKADVVWHSISELLKDIPGKVMDGLNLVEFAGNDIEMAKQQMSQLCCLLDEAIANEQAGIVGYQICDELDDILKIYGMRKKAVGLLGNVQGAAKPIAFTEDTAVPPENLADYILEFRKLLDDKGLFYGMFGHVDAGVLHVRPALDMCDPEQERMMLELSDEVVKLTAKYGGLMWGEHGKGFRSQYSPAFFGKQLFTELRRIKAAFDPLNQLNPGKICTALGTDLPLAKVDSPTRGQLDRSIPIKVRESYTQAMDCNGNGLCFDYSLSSTMCPSLKLSSDRRYSPKGRAGLTREWLRQLTLNKVDILEVENKHMDGKSCPDNFFKKIRNSWGKANGDYDFSHELKEAMDTCLACKACATQCPVKVDVSNFRSRFLFLYHTRYLRPIKDYLVAWSEWYTPLMAKLPAFFNAMVSPGWSRVLTKRFAGMVDIPLLSVNTLKAQLKRLGSTEFNLAKLKKLSPEQKSKTVLIVQDPFTSYYDADVVSDLIKLIQTLGFTAVVLPFKPNGKPQHVKGFLKKFARTAKNTAEFLNQLQQLDIPMMGLDPAMVLCYRDEYNAVLGEQRGDFLVNLFQEWFAINQSQFELQAFAKTDEAQMPWHLLAHCTEKTALPSTNSDWQSIFSTLGQDLLPVSVGCCGMAGTYGHESSKVEDSKAIYNASWKAALDTLPFERCLATGYSCRSQVKRMEGKKMLHPVQALLKASSGNS